MNKRFLQKHFLRKQRVYDVNFAVTRKMLIMSIFHRTPQKRSSRGVPGKSVKKPQKNRSFFFDPQKYPKKTLKNRSKSRFSRFLWNLLMASREIDFFRSQKSLFFALFLPFFCLFGAKNRPQKKTPKKTHGFSSKHRF